MACEGMKRSQLRGWKAVSEQFSPLWATLHDTVVMLCDDDDLVEPVRVEKQTVAQLKYGREIITAVRIHRDTRTSKRMQDQQTDGDTEEKLFPKNPRLDASSDVIVRGTDTACLGFVASTFIHIMQHLKAGISAKRFGDVDLWMWLRRHYSVVILPRPPLYHVVPRVRQKTLVTTQQKP